MTLLAMEKLTNLTTTQIKKALEANRETDNLNLQTNWKSASVLIPLVSIKNEWHLLYTRRANNLFNHSGQVSFPGGSDEPEDGSFIETALRETKEEIGIDRQEIEILGWLDKIPTITQYLITPVVGKINWPTALSVQESEVSRVFTIPINWLIGSNNWEERVYSNPMGWHGLVVFYKEYDGEVLWGVTAKITVNFLQIIGLI